MKSKVTTLQDIQQSCKYLNTKQQLDLWVWWFPYTDEGAKYYFEQVFGDKLKKMHADLDGMSYKLKELAKVI